MSIWKDDLNNRKKNIRSLLTDPRTRPIIFLMSGLIVGMIIVGYMSMSRAKQDPALEPSANLGTRTVDVRTDPSAASSAAHARLQEEANRRALERAQQSQTSSLPSLIGNTGVGDPLSLPNLPGNTDDSTSQAPVAQLPQTPPVQYTPPPAVAPPPQYAVAPPPAPVVPTEAAPHIQDQVNGYLNLWGPSDLQLQEFSYVRTARQDAEQNGSGTPGSQSNQNNQAALAASNFQQEQSQIRFVRAGTVVPARMMTPLNSDNPGPVLAEITSGPLKGARLMGRMAVQREAILVTFNTITRPGWPDTYTVSAVGMTDDGYTGMATDVNKHYLQRYTALLAGSFLRGYGDGLSQQGSTTIITDGGAVVNTQDDLNTRQIRNKGYGEVASAIGQEVSSNARRDVTIEVKGPKGQMYDFKVLFLENF